MADPTAPDVPDTAEVLTRSHHRIVVIGGGNGGLSVAGRLRRMGVDDIVVVEPRSHHLYQPLFSHVAGGTAPASMAIKPQQRAMPKGVQWIQDRVIEIAPTVNTVALASGNQLTYDHVIVCPGMTNDFDRVPGLAEAIQTPHAASHYEFDLAQKASTLLRDFERGTVIFTQPAGPASCAGASQKPMYLACDFWRATGRLDDIRVIMLVPDETIFGIPMIDEELNRKIAEYGIELRTKTELLQVDGAERSVLVGSADGSISERLDYDLLHDVPPQSAPDWLKTSVLPADGTEGGFVEVDPQTLRHPRFPTVWALGDAAATTNSKSGGALRKQTLVLAKNLAAVLAGQDLPALYNGYSVAPFTVSRGSVVFAEFDDEYRQKPTLPFWKGLARERKLTWVFDRYVLPWVYWHMIVKGRA